MQVGSGCLVALLVFLHLLWHSVQLVYRLSEQVLRFPS